MHSKGLFVGPLPGGRGSVRAAPCRAAIARERFLPLALVAALLASCSGSSDAVRDFSSREVVLPSGARILAEVMTHPTDRARGMMFRDSLAPDRGMLFVHDNPSKNKYWMYQVKIPLDIIWLDASNRVVEISANTPPCPSRSAKDCPSFGGNESALYVLELAGGQAQKYGIQVGSVLKF